MTLKIILRCPQCEAYLGQHGYAEIFVHGHTKCGECNAGLIATRNWLNLGRVSCVLYFATIITFVLIPKGADVINSLLVFLSFLTSIVFVIAFFWVRIRLL